MPHAHQNLDKALDAIDDELADLVAKYVKRNKERYEKLLKALQADLKKDAKRYAKLLAEEKIETADFEFLLHGRWAQLKVELLAEASVSKARFGKMADDLLTLTMKKVLEEV